MLLKIDGQSVIGVPFHSVMGQLRRRPIQLTLVCPHRGRSPL
jgi:hypothetical protein